jgi:hypothetical protein
VFRRSETAEVNRGGIRWIESQIRGSAGSFKAVLESAKLAVCNNVCGLSSAQLPR